MQRSVKKSFTYSPSLRSTIDFLANCLPIVFTLSAVFFLIVCCLFNTDVEVSLLTDFPVCRYQRSVEWASELLRRQGRDESTVRSILEGYTKPLEHPRLKTTEEVALGDEPNSEVVSKSGGRADREKLSAVNGVEGKPCDLEDSSERSDGLQEGLGPEPRTPDGSGEDVAEVPAPLPYGHWDALLLPSGGQPGDSSRRAGERGPEHVLVEDAVCAGSESEAVQAEDVSKREEITSCRAVCSWPRDAGQRGRPSLGPGSGLVSSTQGLGEPVQDTPCRPSAGPGGPEGSAVRAVSTKTSESVNNLALCMGNNTRQVTSCPLSGRRTQR